MERKTTYFDKPGGEENTNNTLALVKQRAEELDIKTIVLASTVGGTAVKAMDVDYYQVAEAIKESAKFCRTLFVR